MDKILNKIIRQVIVEATTVKRLTNQVNSDTILNKLIKQVITEAAQKVVISKLDNKVIALTSKYGFGFKISANYPISLDQVRGKIQINSQVGTSSPYNSYLNYTYFVGSNMHKNPDKKFVANVIIVDAVTMKSFNSARFNAAVKNLLAPDNGNADVVVDAYRANTVGRKDGDLEIKHHKARGTEAVYNSNDGNYNRGSDLIFIDKEPDYARLPADLMTVLTKKGAALMSTDDDNNLANKNSNATTYFNSGVVKLRSNDDEGAIADFDAAIKLDPKYVAAYENRGNVKANLKDYAGAIADFSEAIKLDPNNKYLYSARSNAKNNETPGSGNEDLKTYDILNKGGKLPDANTTPVVDKPVGDKENNEADKMVELDKAIELNPKNAYNYYERAGARGGGPGAKDQVADLSKAIELDPKFLLAYAYRGYVKEELKDYAGAIADFDEAIKLDPENGRFYTDRARMKLELKDYAGAIADDTKAIELFMKKGESGDAAAPYRQRGEAKNSLEPKSGDEDIKTADMKLNPSLAIKKQTFKYGMRDNADLKTLQDEIKAKLKASDQTYITSVPALKAFMNVANMTGYYGTTTSNLIASLKKAYAYKNFTGGIIEPDFLVLLIGKMNSKLQLTEQFNFTDTEKKLISTKPVDGKPVEKEPVDTKQPTELTDFKFTKIPGGQNNYRSAQITANLLPSVIKKYGIKNIIRMNGDGHDSKHRSTYPETSKSTEERICKENGCTYYYIDSHSGFKVGQGYTQSIQQTNDILNKGNTLIHCAHGADRTGAMVGAYLKNNGYMTDKDELWKYTTQFNGWQSRINSNTFFGSGFDRYADGFYPISDLRNSKWVNGNKSIKKGDIKKDEPLSGDRLDVALTKAYQICLDAAKYLKKITTTNPHDYWSKYLRWDGASYRPNANKKGIAWFNSSWEKYYGTKLAAAAKIRNTATQKNINELNRRKNDIIEMIRKGGSMTVYLRIQNPSTGAPTDFKIKWDYFAGIQNAAVKGNPKKTVTNKQAQDFYNKKGKYRKPIENPGLAD